MFFFSKMQATGNDFVIINYIEENLQYSFRLLAKFLCNRHFGVGADGIIIIEKSLINDFKMRIFNQDGTEAEMCGNGIRCFAKYLYEKNITSKKEFTIETLAGEKKVNLEIEGNTVVSISVDMGKPIFNFEKIPVNYNESILLENTIDNEIENGVDITDNNKKKCMIDNKLENMRNLSKHIKIILDKTETENIQEFMVYPVSIGNPHIVVFVENVEHFDVKKYGRLLENYKYFPNKINIEFVEIIDNSEIKVRVWERGVGETLACGTGACAATVISCIQKSTDSRLTVDLPGGKLQIDCSRNIIMTGPAEFIFEGQLNI